jgi:hypothetical protein
MVLGIALMVGGDNTRDTLTAMEAKPSTVIELDIVFNDVILSI